MNRIASSESRTQRTWLKTLIQPTLFVLLGLVLFTASASAAPFVYVVTVNQQFGTVDLATGTFHPIGAPAAEPMSNLVWGRDGSLFTLFSQSGSLVKINPLTGNMTVVGPTGLGLNAFDLAGVHGKLYLTDFSNNIYSVNPHTGAATFLRDTGMPPDPTVPFTTNSDGTFNLCDETLYGVNGELYATFDSYDFDPTPSTSFLVIATKVTPKLYRIDPLTGEATPIGHTDVQLSAAVAVDKKFYAFRAVLTGFAGFPQGYSELVTLDLTSGKVSYIRTIDPATGVIFGAAPVRPPED
jgi:hypothetical protein